MLPMLPFAWSCKRVSSMFKIFFVYFWNVLPACAEENVEGALPRRARVVRVLRGGVVSAFSCSALCLHRGNMKH